MGQDQVTLLWAYSTVNADRACIFQTDPAAAFPCPTIRLGFLPKGNRDTLPQSKKAARGSCGSWPACDAAGLSLTGCFPCLPDNISEMSCIPFHSMNTLHSGARGGIVPSSQASHLFVTSPEASASLKPVF